MRINLESLAGIDSIKLITVLKSVSSLTFTINDAKTEVIKEFSKAGMLRRVLTRIWNKEGVARVGILFEYRNEKAFVECQTLLDKYHAPKVKTFVNKVVGSRGIVLHEFTAEDFK